MNNYPNYEQYELLGGFTPSSLSAYRQSLLQKTAPQTSFIEGHVLPLLGKRKLSVIEVGTGNGRLLIDLALKNRLEFGYGMDMSESRIEFAKDWYKDPWIIRFEAADVLARNPSPYYDLAVCITGCFQYFYPIAPDAPEKVLSYMRQSADYALFELYKRPQMGRTWRPLPEGDRWMYLLDEYEDLGDWVKHKKLFIDLCRPEDDLRVEYLAYYILPVFLKHLRAAGYRNVHWAVQDQQSIVILVS